MARMLSSCSSRIAFCVALVAIFQLTAVRCQISSMREVCKGYDYQRVPASGCHQYVECRNGVGTVKTCGNGTNYNVVRRRCDKSACSGNRGLWRQLMPTGGLVAVHCTLIANTGLVAVWHRGIAWWAISPEPGMAQAANPKLEMLSAVLDPKQNRYRGYNVGPPFCSGHVQLHDGSILSCGGEWGNMTSRTADPENGIYKCRIFKCSKATVDSCSWTTIGNLAGRRWYPGMILFPPYNPAQGPFAMVMGGTRTAQDPERVDDVSVFIDWIWPFAGRNMRTFAASPATNFTLRTLDTNLYPVVFLMPFRVNQQYVMFQWAVNYGELATVADPAKNINPIAVWKHLPPIKPDVAVTYPSGGCAAIHPLEYPWNTSKVTFFGGHWGTYNNFSDLSKINAWYLAAKRAWTISLSANEAEQPEWQVEPMPDNAVMRTCLGLPNGKILLVHGVRYGRETSTKDGRGCSKEAVKNAWTYDPKAVEGSRFAVDDANNPTYRAYHSCGLLMPDGSLFAGGGDTDPVPSGGDCTGPRKLHYNIDGYVPSSRYKALLGTNGPAIVSYHKSMQYNRPYNIKYSGTVDDCSLVTPGANTHVVEQSSRVVFLRVMSNNRNVKVIKVMTPEHKTVIMPGPHMLFCVHNRDAYSQGVWVNLQ